MERKVSLSLDKLAGHEGGGGGGGREKGFVLGDGSACSLSTVEQYQRPFGPPYCNRHCCYAPINSNLQHPPHPCPLLLMAYLGNLNQVSLLV